MTYNIATKSTDSRIELTKRKISKIHISPFHFIESFTSLKNSKSIAEANFMGFFFFDLELLVKKPKKICYIQCNLNRHVVKQYIIHIKL